MVKTTYKGKYMAIKSFKQMNKEELIKAVESFGIMDKVIESAKDKEAITNAEYVTVLEAFKASQDEINSETKEELEKIENEKGDESVDTGLKIVVDPNERAKLKQIMYKYIVTDHQNSVTIEDDDVTRTFPIQYGNLTTGPKNNKKMFTIINTCDIIFLEKTKEV